jgi:hypothetical protein
MQAFLEMAVRGIAGVAGFHPTPRTSTTVPLPPVTARRADREAAWQRNSYQPASVTLATVPSLGALGARPTLHARSRYRGLEAREENARHAHC